MRFVNPAKLRVGMLLIHVHTRMMVRVLGVQTDGTVDVETVTSGVRWGLSPSPRWSVLEERGFLQYAG